MNPEEIKQVTERFYRTNSACPKGGFGLGLAIAYEVCRIQGGSLQIESELAKGTVVRLLLPTQMKNETSAEIVSNL